MNPTIFARITKVDEAKRLVYARIVEEVPDKADEIFDYASSKPHFEAWSKNQFDASAGKSYGNVRAMHGKIAAGIVAEPLSFSDTEKAIDGAIKVTDDQEWSKCLDGTYTGVSIGGSYVGDRKPEKMGDRELKRYTASPVEISLVDSPCVPTARFFDIVKADGSVVKTEFKNSAGASADAGAVDPPKVTAPVAEGEVKKAEPEPIEVRGTDAQVAELGSVLNASGLTLGDAIKALAIEAMLDTIEAMEKREFSADERKKAAKEGHALPDGSFPINTVQDLKNAVQAYGRAKDKAKAKAHIMARAKALGATKELPDSWTKGGDKAAEGELKKGMWNVSRFAECLECLASICQGAEYDLQAEGDDSPVPMKLRNELDDLIECFKEMADEESAEMLAGLKAHAGVGEDDEIEEAMEAAHRAGELRKTLLNPETPLERVIEIAKAHEEPVTTTVLADMPGLTKRVVAKAMTQAHMDKIQAVHDHAADMGAECRSDKAATGDLAKVDVSGLEKKLDDALAKIKRLEDQPVPHVMLRTISKEQANGSTEARPAASWLLTLPYEKLAKLPGGEIDWVASERLNASLKPAGVV